MRVRSAGIAAAAYVAIVAILAMLFPDQGASYSGAVVKWLVGIPIYLAIWFSLEWSGEKFLGLSFWQQMPSFARVLLLVICIVVVIIAAKVVMNFAHAL